MSYSYTRSSILGSGEPKDQYITLFQQTLNEQFYNSSDWWVILEQLSNGSTVFNKIDAKVNHVINAETGLKLGDDWKTLLFKDADHPVDLGKQYNFNDNIWITVNTEIVKNLTSTCTIRRCNNTLRWIDEATGAYYEEPCAIEYLVKEPRNYFTSGSPFITPGGFLHIEMQFNETSNKIRQNQRFLFGNAQHWTCYKVIGTGLNDFRNNNTYNRDSAKILALDLVADFVNMELDDIIIGIADVNTNLYSLSLNRSTGAGIVNDTIQLIPTITYNGSTVTRSVVWETSNTNIATVDSNGLVTLKLIGQCTITATVEGNPANDTCVITVSSTPAINTDILLNPDLNYVLEGTQRQFSVFLYKNNIQQGDTFTLTCNGNSVPSTSYVFTQDDGNHFSITNKLRDISSYLTITAVSGSETRTFDISLHGAW